MPRVAQLRTVVGAFAVFLVLLVGLNRRRGLDPFPAEQRRWLLAIVACAGVAIVIGLVSR